MYLTDLLCEEMILTSISILCQFYYLSQDYSFLQGAFVLSIHVFALGLPSCFIFLSPTNRPVQEHLLLQIHC